MDIAEHLDASLSCCLLFRRNNNYPIKWVVVGKDAICLSFPLKSSNVLMAGYDAISSFQNGNAICMQRGFAEWQERLSTQDGWTKNAANNARQIKKIWCVFSLYNPSWGVHAAIGGENSVGLLSVLPPDIDLLLLKLTASTPRITHVDVEGSKVCKKWDDPADHTHLPQHRHVMAATESVSCHVPTCQDTLLPGLLI